MAAKELIQTITVGAGGAASIEFTGIPATGTDLILKVSIRRDNTGTVEPLEFRLNGDTGSNYSYRVLRAYSNSTVASVSGTTDRHFVDLVTPGSSATSNTFNNVDIYLPNYAGSTAKTTSVDAVSENNAETAGRVFYAGLWSGTAAIDSIKIYSATVNLAQYSTASLYKFTKGSGGATVA